MLDFKVNLIVYFEKNQTLGDISSILSLNYTYVWKYTNMDIY